MMFDSDDYVNDNDDEFDERDTHIIKRRVFSNNL